MKHLESVNEWFDNKPKEGDEFAKKIIDIIEKENIELGQYLDFYLDNIMYRFYEDMDMRWRYYGMNNKYLLLIYRDKTVDYLEHELEISKKYYKYIQELYLKQEKDKKRKKLEKLPDISDVGRMKNKFNI